MCDDEVREFEKNPYLKEILKVRYLDEAGKREDMSIPSFSYFAPMVQRIVDQYADEETSQFKYNV